MAIPKNVFLGLIYKFPFTGITALRLYALTQIKRVPFGRIHLRIHSLKRYLFAPLFVENARKTTTSISALFALMDTKIRSFETLRGLRPSK